MRKLLSLIRRFSSVLLILAGVGTLIVAGNLYWQRIAPREVAFTQSDWQSFPTVYKGDLFPTVLTISDLGITLPIYPAEVTNNKWQTTDKGVSYLTSTPIPGNEGNSVIYGHNWHNLLGNLLKAKIGQQITVVFSDGSKRNFKISFIQEVGPNQTDILKSSSDKRITLYTCSGILDSKRFVVTAITS